MCIHSLRHDNHCVISIMSTDECEYMNQNGKTTVGVFDLSQNLLFFLGSGLKLIDKQRSGSVVLGGYGILLKYKRNVDRCCGRL